jgi:hypothetical protein
MDRRESDAKAALADRLQADDAAGQRHRAGRRRQQHGIERQCAGLGGDEAGGAGGDQEDGRCAPAAADLDRQDERQAGRQQRQVTRRLDRQGEVDGGTGSQRHRQPQHPVAALRFERGGDGAAQHGGKTRNAPHSGRRRRGRPPPGQVGYRIPQLTFSTSGIKAVGR